MRGYKFLRRGAVGPISEVGWPSPAADAPGAWVKSDGALAQCRAGVHVLGLEDLAYWIHDELWLVVADGAPVDGIDCVVVPRARLVRRIDAWEKGGFERFAHAARDHFASLVPTSAPSCRALVEAIVGDADAMIGLPSPAMGAYAAAMGAARLTDPNGDEAAYRRERAWQSAWIARQFDL